MAIQLLEGKISAGPISISKQQLAGITTLLVYVVGTCGLLLGDFNFFVRSTPIILILSLAFILWTETNRDSKFFIFLFVSFLISMFLEIVGIQTGIVFGRYTYSNLLGIKFMEVPVIIGVNWLVLVYAVGNLVNWITKKICVSNSMILSIVGGALVATLFDWIMEPAAARLGYWHWMNGTTVPVSNYLSWSLVSAVLIFLYKKFCKNRINHFAIFLLAIQTVFFIVIQLFLH